MISTEGVETRIRETGSRWVLDRRVYVPEDGTAPFIVQIRARGKALRFGEIRTCVKCHREFFWSSGANPNQQHCSHKCSAKQHSKTQRAASAAKGGPALTRLDKWFSAIVRAQNWCSNCGASRQLQCAHIVSRRYHGVRYEFENAICLCAPCHMAFTHRPLEWEAYVIKQMGEERYLALKRRALAFRGPLDRVAIAAELYRIADEKGLNPDKGEGWSGWHGLNDNDGDFLARIQGATL